MIDVHGLNATTIHCVFCSYQTGYTSRLESHVRLRHLHTLPREYQGFNPHAVAYTPKAHKCPEASPRNHPGCTSWRYERDPEERSAHRIWGPHNDRKRPDGDLERRVHFRPSREHSQSISIEDNTTEPATVPSMKELPLDDYTTCKPTSPKPVYGSNQRHAVMWYDTMLKELKHHMKFSELLTSLENRFPENQKEFKSKGVQTEATPTYSGDHSYIDC